MISQPSHARSSTQQRIFVPDFSGRTVFDVALSHLGALDELHLVVRREVELSADDVCRRARVPVRAVVRRRPRAVVPVVLEVSATRRLTRRRWRCGLCRKQRCFASVSSESVHADTLVSSEQVLANPVLTRTGIAVIDQTVAVGPCPADHTVAVVSIDEITTRAVLARTRLTFVDISLTEVAGPASVTDAVVAIDLVLTLSVEAWV
jgi:hypothetical protein